MSQVNELDAVKRRIRALAEKTISNGCTESEAMLAMEKVGELLQTFNLSMTEVILSEQPCIKEVFDTHSKHTGVVYEVCTNLARFCGVKTWGIREYNSLQVAFFGLESDVQMAMYLSNMIDKSFDRCVEDFKRSDTYYYSKSRRGSSSDFRKGFSARIRVKLDELHLENVKKEKEDAAFHAKEMKERMLESSDSAKAEAARQTTGTALISVAKQRLVDREYEKMGLKLRYTQTQQRIHGYDSYYAGNNAAKSVNLSRPINGHNKAVAGYLT